MLPNKINRLLLLKITVTFSVLLVFLSLVGCQRKENSDTQVNVTSSLKETYRGEFKVGAALSRPQVAGNIPEATEVIKRHFNATTPENLLKFGPVHPQPDQYNFEPADRYVEFGEETKMFIIGHTLVWHQQTPDWVFETESGGEPTRKELLKRMEDHISTVMGRYKGRINGWDVVNEAVTDEGERRQTKWQQIIGDDYIEQAFRFAHEADPEAELYYNDYNLWKPAKREAVIKLIKGLQEKDVQVDGIGMQAHLAIDYPPVGMIEESIKAFSELGVKVNITELDIDVLPKEGYQVSTEAERGGESSSRLDPYKDALPDSVQQQLTNRYVELFKMFKKHSDVIDRVTLWGVSDRQSWLNNFPIRGRTNYPLLFDRNYEPKPALQAVIEVAGDSES